MINDPSGSSLPYYSMGKAKNIASDRKDVKRKRKNKS